jgi:CubicO group peptidase (beta-lactamase class C family)
MRSFSRAVAALALAAVSFPAAVAAQVVAYHGASSAAHQTQFTQLSAQGYRIVSLNVAGSLSAPTYSAVWEQVAGPAWVAAHDMSQTQYLAAKANWESQGYRAKLLTAAGTTFLSRVWAAVFVADGATVSSSHQYPESTFLDTCASQRAAGRILVSADLFGDAAGYWIAGVFEPNPNEKVWGCHIDATSTEFGETRMAHRDGGARLAAIGMSDTQRYISVWYDERVGDETIAVNQTGTGWQNLFNIVTQTQYPRLIAAGGSGSSQRFAGAFAELRAPMPRTTTITGTWRQAFVNFDTHMTGILSNSKARAAALAIAKDGKLVYARGFTRAEAGYPITQPDDVFRIASLTKVFNAVATSRAVQEGLFTTSDRPQAVLNLPYTATGFDDIQVRHILEYVSGIQRNYDAGDIAAAMSTSLPTSLVTGVNWLDDQALRYQPPVGTPTTSSFSSYSNAAWMLTGECIRVRSGQSFATYLQQHVFSPLGIARAKVAPSSFAQLTANDVFPHLSWLRTMTTELDNSGERVSRQFGEDLNFKRTSGGMACSAIDFVRFLSGTFDLQGGDAIVLNDTRREYALDPHTFTDFDDLQPSQLCRAGMAWHTRPGNVIAYSKGGALESASTHASWRTDGISFAIFVAFPDVSLGTDTLQTMLDNFTAWPNVDEFPAYGMPAFPRRAAIDSIVPASLPNVTTGTFTVTGQRMDTVTQVNFGSIQITGQTPATWYDGWFEIVSPTTLRIHPPQGRIPTSYAVRLVNAVGAGNSADVDLTQPTTFRIAGSSTVGNHPWSVAVARGTGSGLPLQGSFVMLCASFSNVPSAVPGFVTLGLGNQFAELLTTGAEPWGLLNSSVRFNLPPLPTGTIYLEAIGLDFTAPSLFPIPTTTTLAVTRQ